MVPTAKALAIHAQVAGTLDLWQQLGDGDLSFSPAKTTRGYTVLASDYVQFLLLPALAREMKRQAPFATLHVIPSNPYRRLQVLVEREADLAIGYYHEAPEDLRARRLFVEPMVCVMRKDHPAAARFDASVFTQHEHVTISSVRQGSYSATLEQALAVHGIQRNASITVPSYLVVPQLLLQTDYLALLPASLAASYVSLLPLEAFPSPIELPPLDISILYHNNDQDDFSHRWFRQLVVDVVEQAGLSKHAPANTSSAAAPTPT